MHDVQNLEVDATGQRFALGQLILGTMVKLLLLFAVVFVLHGCHGREENRVADPIFSIEVFKAGELGYECFRIPSLLFTSKGTLLAFAEGRGQQSKSCSDHGDVHIVLRKSSDLGHTWSNLSVVYTESHNTIGKYSLSALQVGCPHGRVVLGCLSIRLPVSVSGKHAEEIVYNRFYIDLCL